MQMFFGLFSIEDGFENLWVSRVWGLCSVFLHTWEFLYVFTMLLCILGYITEDGYESYCFRLGFKCVWVLVSYS
jgi:TctA family transporter